MIEHGGGIDRRSLDERMRLTRTGLHFVDPQVEQEFRAWNLIDAVPYARAGLITGILGWLTAYAAIGATVSGTAASAAPYVFGVVLPIMVFALALTFGPSRWMLGGACVANLVAGLVATVVMGFHVLRDVGTASLAIVIISLVGFTVLRLHPWMAAVGVGLFTTAHQVLVVVHFNRHEYTSQVAIVNSVLPWVAYGTGLVVCCVLSQLAHEAFRNQRIIEAQSAEIERERQRSDDLLRNILPDEIANRLKDVQGVIADGFDDVTVLFADIVGFTPLASSTPPEELVRLLDRVFTRFDELADRHGVEKIKTIGDAYMAVAGLPQPRGDHARAVAMLALDMQVELRELNVAGVHEISCRIGVASGPAVAGVIGTRKFAYDLWGHTVNMAARMESHGKPGCIQVNESAYTALRGTFTLTPRGTIDIKGAGPTRTWFLEGFAHHQHSTAARERDRTIADATGGPRQTKLR